MIDLENDQIATRSINDGPPFFSITSTATELPELGEHWHLCVRIRTSTRQRLCIFCCLGQRGTNSKSSALHALCHDRSTATPESSLAWIVRLGPLGRFHRGQRSTASMEVWGLNDCHDKEATSSDTSEGRPRPVVVHRHRDARKQTQ